LTPTRLYVQSTLAAFKAGKIQGLAHITGGGLTENLPRVLPEGCAAQVDLDAWDLPPVFKWLAQEGQMHAAELLKTFNSGIGMVAVVREADVADAVRILAEHGEIVVPLGQVTEGDGQVYYSGAIA
jgi:phosphoribosylformylglycinamidine cyclo-ligase